MFAHRYFAATYWAIRYWPPTGGELGEPEPPAEERARGGKPRFRYVNETERKEEKPRPRQRPQPKPQPVFEAQPLPDVVVLELPGHAPMVIAPETWQRITTNVRLREQVRRPQYQPKDLDVEAELIRHFAEMVGGGDDVADMMRMPDLEFDEETAPFMLVRFLRQGKQEKK